VADRPENGAADGLLLAARVADRAVAGQAPPMREGAGVDELVGLVVDGIAGGRRELRYDLRKGELVVR
jgi:hypothetical protein